MAAHIGQTSAHEDGIAMLECGCQIADGIEQEHVRRVVGVSQRGAPGPAQSRFLQFLRDDPEAVGLARRDNQPPARQLPLGGDHVVFFFELAIGGSAGRNPDWLCPALPG